MKVEKYYPSGFLRPEYVESLFDELIITDQERLIEKFADRFGYTKNEGDYIHVVTNSLICKL